MLQKEIYRNIFQKSINIVKEEKKDIGKLVKKLNKIAYEYGKQPITPQQYRQMMDEIEKEGVYIGAYYGNGQRGNDNDPYTHIWKDVPVLDNETDEELLYCRISRYDGYKYGKEYIITFYK